MLVSTRSKGSAALAIAVLFASSTATAESDAARRDLSAEELASWLAAPADGASAPAETSEEREAPPPRPRHQGFIVEAGLGAAGHIGPLRHVSPVSPWFHMKVGFEPFRWLLVFAETDLVFSSTAYANPPPGPRTYRLYGGGGGLRGTVRPWELFGLHAEASLGGARVSEDVLAVYGYRNARELHPYFGGGIGLEWYPVNPHLTATLHARLRSYDRGLSRERSDEPALAWLSGLALRYTF